jgi:hypothetical protein
LLPVVLLIPVSDDGEDDLLLVYSFICGDIPDGNDDDTLVRWLTEAIFAPVATSVNREVALVLFVVAIFCCCFEVDIPAALLLLALLLLLVAAAMMTLLMPVALLMIIKAVLLFWEYRTHVLPLY